MGEPRKAMCTSIAAEVAAATAEAALRHGAEIRVIDVPETRDG